MICFHVWPQKGGLMSDIKKPVGQLILEHDQKQYDLEDDVREYTRIQAPDIMATLYDTADKVKNHNLYQDHDFYVVMMYGPDRVLRQPKRVIFARRSCPTPVYKQSVWRYRQNTDSLEFLWSIPDMLRYYDILHNKQKYLDDVSWADITKTVILMESGELLEWVKKENGEKIDAVIKISPNEENECLIN